MTGKEIANLPNQSHLNQEQKKQLTSLLEEMKEVFQGKVGNCEGIKVGFELKPNAKPRYIRQYSIPVLLEKVTKNTIYMMWEQGILKKVDENTAWAAPTFAVPKKTAGVRIVSNFRALNQWIKRSPWPMPSPEIYYIE